MWVLIKFTCLLLFTLILAVYANQPKSIAKHRMKRKVVFSKSSKFFFRLNGKDNIVNYTEIFAHGWTIRMNYDLPENIPKRHQFFKRDVHAELETVADESTQKIYSCILKYVCESITKLKLSENCGMFCGIGNIIAKSQGMESSFFKSIGKNCDFHVDNCPYLFKDAYLSNYG